jgi:hypothetical protein
MAAAAAASAPTPLQGNLQTFPGDMQETLFTHLTTGDLCALSGACRGLHALISSVRAREPAYVQRMLTAYQSPAHVLGSQSQRPALGELDDNIRGLEGRLRQIREARRAAPGEHRDPAEEIRIERHLNTLRASRLPSRSIIDLALAYSHPLSDVIDTKQWNVLIGQVPNRPLSPHIKTLLGQSSFIFPDLTINETHVCIDIPPTVDGQPLTLNRLRHFAEHNRGNRIPLNIHWDEILRELGDVPIPAGQCLLLKTCLPDTKGKTHRQQLEVLNRHPEYMEATLSQILVASLMEYIRSGGAKTRLFEEEYARTSTTVGNLRLDFGGFGSFWPGVDIGADDGVRDSLGLAVVVRPGGGSPVLGP